MEPLKIRVKIGNSEFDAEGAEGTVKEQFAAFMEAVKASSSAVAPAPAPPAPPPADPFVGLFGGAKKRESIVTTDDGARDDELSDLDGLDSNVIDRIFARDKVGRISLRLLPKSDEQLADTLILLMYGHKLFHGDAQVLASELTIGARQSGAPVDRVDRALGSRQELVNSGGQKRGKRYGLNNRGLAQARRMVLELNE